MRRDVFQAIADPNRRAILSLLAKNERLNLNGVAQNFRISRPAVSRHIKILKECGLVIVIQEGRERYCEAKFDKLDEVTDWIEKYRQFWEERFSRLDKVLAELKKQEKKKKCQKIKQTLLLNQTSKNFLSPANLMRHAS
ncbi:MAG: transcriptional regulator, ArsR family [Chloroflexi bacterium OLB14]|nr:MAG: transcriptional regulator, ArsR family [Chloroflexi bacterium OLB14]